MSLTSSAASSQDEASAPCNTFEMNEKGRRGAGSVACAEHADLLESLYEQWRMDPESVEPLWASFFEGFELGCQQAPAPRTSLSPAPLATSAVEDGLPQRLKQARIYNVLFAYRTLGHHIANLDPLGFNKSQLPELDMHHFKFSDADLDTVFDSGTLASGGSRTLREILQILRETYCGNIGAEYMHIQNFTMRRWMRDRLESTRCRPGFDAAKKRRILNRLLEAEQFERFLHTRYVGQKRFSLEGGETLIPMLDAIVEACPRLGIKQIVMGMPHRGRLNVLANILGKDYKFLFNEFADNYVPQAVQGDGDVKYHLGFDATRTTSTGENVGLSLAPNPSHLEAVGPVVQGKARAYQRLLNDTVERHKVLPVLLHGDAAFIGQGVVAETFNLSQLEGYRTGGTLHIVVNNQIGFTTLPEDARSTVYCTALAKMLGAPILHVNGDDPVAAVFCVELALDFRQRFSRDIVVDMVCYRKHGHNEGDEPSFTQPTLYTEIARHPPISEICLRNLVASGDITEAEAASFKARFEERLNTALSESKAAVQAIRPTLRKPLACPALLEQVDTAPLREEIEQVGEALSREPNEHEVNPKIRLLLRNRGAMARGELPVDWSCAEALAFGTLLKAGVPIRLSGQDSRRGTFSQRHSVLYDTRTRERYIPLRNISPNQASLCVYNSPLSEYAVLGFDYGYSLDYPNIMVLWEAQFGDFANGAQVMIDQYLASSESKWGVTSNITLLLPHGYEGQGPEHSSARIERFLQLCAEDNWVVAYPSTPASYFHILRRQALRSLRKPLILFTPKSLLRDKRCVSLRDELFRGRFSEILPDPAPPKTPARRVVLCTGKIYYDLADARTEEKREDIAILRTEQLYPLHESLLKSTVDAVAAPDAKIVWCQEESQNMGAWSFMEPRLRRLFGRDIQYAGRDASVSPAVGSLAVHKLEQRDVIRQAFDH
jgi:2-oxoglutarate dehydrogenase E1 component